MMQFCDITQVKIEKLLGEKIPLFFNK